MSASCVTAYLPNPGTEWHRFATSAINARLNRAFPAPPSEGNRCRHSRFRLRDGPILLQRGVIPAPDSAAWLSPPVGGRGQLARDSEMDGSYLLNTNSQNIVQCAAAQRAVTTADVQKMTQTEERQSAVFTELCTARTANSRVQREGECTVWSSTSAVTTALILLWASAWPRRPIRLLGKPAAFSSARLIAAASRLSAWSALNVIHEFIVAAARDSSEAAAADSRFTEIFLASALPNQDSDSFPSCTVVIEQFDRLGATPGRQEPRNPGRELGLLIGATAGN